MAFFDKINYQKKNGSDKLVDLVPDVCKDSLGFKAVKNND
jgi:hypothetical protein